LADLNAEIEPAIQGRHQQQGRTMLPIAYGNAIESALNYWKLKG
jgi:hypothetical protein